jgi:MFS family permease
MKEDSFNNKKNQGDNKLGRESSSSDIKSSIIEPTKNIRTSVWITIAVLGSTILITMYGETMLLPAIRDIIREFNISYSTSSWLLTAYLISGAVATPIAGKLSDIYGSKKMVLSILIIYIAGISIGGFSTDLSILLLARIIQGIGISMFPIAFGIIRDQFPRDKLAIGVGVFSSMFAAGSVVGLAVGGNVIQTFGWHATFLSIIPFAISLWIIIKIIIPHDKRDALTEPGDNKLRTNNDTVNSKLSPSDLDIVRRHSVRRGLDITGAIALAATIASFLLMLTYIGNSSYGGNNGSAYPTQIIIISLALLSLGSLFLFIIIERRAQTPLIELSLMRNGILLPANIIILIFGMTMFMVYQTIPIMVRSPHPFGFGGNAVESAMVQLPFMIVFLIFAPASGFIVSKIGNLRPTIAGTIIMTIGFFMLYTSHSTELIIAIDLAIVAIGISAIQVGAFNITMEYTPRQFSGVSLGVSVVLVLIGSAIGPVIAATYMQTHQSLARGVISGFFPSPISYNLIFLTASLISIISIGLVLVLRQKMVQAATAAVKS